MPCLELHAGAEAQYLGSKESTVACCYVNGGMLLCHVERAYGFT